MWAMELAENGCQADSNLPNLAPRALIGSVCVCVCVGGGMGLSIKIPKTGETKNLLLSVKELSGMGAVADVSCN